ncbi:methyl-accepting chemotaxis protein [Paucimonas lemoignei]|uniref:Methyl-accepting chemotaxis protein n=1 Tax=Paucimonas lemoignei TaxID=29443 RepID=A0A4R3I171_PAULE|nr:methyl-accepting chemotaxis protein [Paucimonas lemoignei]TCS38335.1 methyl-accepting chemotaxis protein [Paucimonas lemoignei]
MKIANTRVGTRLGVGFALVMVLLAGVTALGIMNMSQVQQRLDKVLTSNNVQSRLAATMRNAVMDRMIGLRNVALVQDATELEQELDRIRSQNQQYLSAEEQLEQMLTSSEADAETKAVLEKVKAAANAAKPLMAKAMELGQARQQAEATRVLMEEVRPVQEQWLAGLDELVRTVDKQSILYGFDSSANFESARNLMLTLGGIAMLLGVAAAFVITRSLLRQLGGEPAVAVEIAERIAHGDLNVEIKLKSGDDSSMLHALRAMRDSLAKLVSQVRAGTDAIASASNEIAAGNMDLSSRTEAQASSLEQTASSVEELTSTVKQNADNARQANTLAQSASEVASQGGVVVSEVVETMGSINDSSKKIVDIISVIDGIAFQTNILALNAAVEAARAGEQGRGFAVVAAEVRSLAQRSAAAAKEIKELIGNSVERVEAGTKLVDQAGVTMQEIVTSIRRVTDIIGEITAASTEQTAGIEQINLAISQMDNATQQNAALVEEAAAAAQSMQSQAGKLAQLVGVFKVNSATVARTLPAQKAGASKAAAPKSAAPAVSAPAVPALSKPAAAPSPVATARASTPARAPEPLRKAAPPRNGDDDWEEF